MNRRDQLKIILPASAAAMFLLATNWLSVPILASQWAVVMNGLRLAASHIEFIAEKRNKLLQSYYLFSKESE